MSRNARAVCVDDGRDDYGIDCDRIDAGARCADAGVLDDGAGVTECVRGAQVTQP